MTRVRIGLAGVLAGVALAVPAWGQARTEARPPELFDLQKIADGVYAALAKPRTPINCNAAVVVLDDGVLVVDTHSRPSSARALIAQIRTITDKPVTFAVNTHFHWDHAQGNHAYPVAFPKRVAIVAWLPKERVIATGDLLHGWMPYMGDSYPPEWVATLDALDKLEFDHIVGGHGTVKPRSHLTFFRNYLADLIAAVRTARDRGETLAQATASVTAVLAPKYDAGMNGEFAGSVGANIEKVYQDLEAKKY